MRLIAPLLLLLLMFAGVASAGTDYYVSTTGDNTNDGLSISAPKENFSHTEWFNDTLVKPGDTIWLLHGTWYNESMDFTHDSSGAFYLKGNATHHLTIRSYNGTPILDQVDYGTKKYGIQMYPSSFEDAYIDFYNITFRNSNYGVLVKNADRLGFYNLTFDGSKPSPNANNMIHLQDVQNVTFADSSLTQAGWNAIALQAKNRDVKNVVIDGNRFYNNPHHSAIDLYNTLYNGIVRDVIIRNNIIEDCNDGNGTGVTCHDTGGFEYVENITFEDNVWRNYTVGQNLFYADFFLNSTITNDRFYNLFAGITSGLDVDTTNLTFENVSMWGITGKPDVSISTSATSIIRFINTNITSFRVYYGNFTVKNNSHSPCELTTIHDGRITYNYSTGKIITDNGAGDVFFYANRSEYVTVGNESAITLTTYNITLKPTYDHLKDVSVSHESDAADDRTNISVNSSVSTNPTWINVSMQNASANYSVSVDSAVVEHVIADSGGIVRYHYTSSWSPHYFEFNWVSAAAFVPDHTKAYFNATSAVLNTVNSTEYYVWNRTITSSDTEISSGSMKVTT